MKLSRFVLVCGLNILAATLLGCASNPEAAAPASEPEAQAPAPTNDFPTQARVEYVLECIEKKGGLKYETLYPCICKVDKIAEKMKHHEYDEAKTFTFMRKTPGDQGGIFRTSEAKDMRDKLKEAEEYSERSCVVKTPQ